MPSSVQGSNLFARFARHVLYSALPLAIFLGSHSVACAQIEIPIWTDGPSGLRHQRPEEVEDPRETGRQDRRISFVSQPTLTIYAAPNASKISGAVPAVLVVPGGGFRRVFVDQEGTEPARWLNAIGVTAAVLKYRVLDPAAERTPQAAAPIYRDTARALRTLRHGAAGWGIDQARIGVMGVSAGGGMALRLVADADAGDVGAADPVERASSRPDFVVLVYAFVPARELPAATPAMPPFFIVHADDDPDTSASAVVGVYRHLVRGGASAELHVFNQGGHGFGMQPAEGAVRAWPGLLARWLDERKILPKK